MLRVVERAAHARDVAGDAGRRLVVGEQHRLDLVGLVGSQCLVVPLDRSALAPLGVENVDLETEPLGHVDPQMAEHAEARREHPVAGRQRIQSDASQAPVPLAGKMKGCPVSVLKIFFRSRNSGVARLGKADER